MSTVRGRRLLIVLPYSLHVRNFVASGVVDMLAERGHRVTLVVPRALVESTAADVAPLPVPTGVLAVEPYLAGRAGRWLRDRLRTASYVERAHLSTYRHKLASRRTSLTQRAEVALYRTAARAGSLDACAQRLEALMPPKRAATRLLAETCPDVVVTATFIQDALDVEITKAAKRAGVPVIAFPVSWDTLTSKGAFLVPPDALMVWGDDTQRHAVEYHGYPPERVFVTGPPHFDVYGPTWPAEPRERFLGRRGIDPAKRVLLFAGTTVTYWADEPVQLRALSRAIASGELADCVVWYRPHPRRSYDQVTELADLPGVYLDDTVMRAKQAGVGFSTAREDLAHYRGLIDACDGVIAAFSTMIIEAALVGKPSLVVGFGLADDTPDRVLQHADYDHMRDVVAMAGVTLVRRLSELIHGARRVMRGDFSAYSELLRKRAAEIAHAEDGRARERVVEAIERMAGRAEDRR
jgi:hypothetical protein